MWPIILLGGLLVYSYSNQARAAVESFAYDPVKITKWRPGFTSSGFDFIFKITNNTNTSASISGIDGNLYNGSTLVGTFQVLKPFTIPAGGSVNVEARLMATNWQALQLLYKTITTKQTPAIDFKGAVTTTLLGRIPFNYPALLAQDLTFKKRK